MMRIDGHVLGLTASAGMASDPVRAGPHCHWFIQQKSLGYRSSYWGLSEEIYGEWPKSLQLPEGEQDWMLGLFLSGRCPRVRGRWQDAVKTGLWLGAKVGDR